MKKVLTCITCLVVAATMSLSAMAANIDANKQKILDSMKTSITVDEKTVALPVDMQNQAENYLKRDDVTISDDQVSTVIAQIDKAKDVVKDSGVNNLDKLSSADKNKILDIAQVAAKSVDLKISYNSSKNTIAVMDNDNKIVAVFESVVKVTGPDMTNVAVALSIAVILLAGCAVVAHKSKLAAK